jgi:lipid-binding SYLF domain-containing protein
MYNYLLYKEYHMNLFSKKSIVTLTALSVLLVGSLNLPSADAASSSEILKQSWSAKIKLSEDIGGAQTVLDNAAGYLVFPSVYEAGIGLGGEYGEGVLMVNGQAQGYYNMVSASYGFKLGAQKKSVFIVFTEQGSLDNFLNSDGWEAGADASVAVLKIGTEGSINTNVTNKPVVAFVSNQKGLMYDLSLEGTKITKIDK